MICIVEAFNAKRRKERYCTTVYPHLLFHCHRHSHTHFPSLHCIFSFRLLTFLYYRQLGTHGLPYERTNIMWTDILRIFSKLSEVLSACLLLYEVCVCVAGWHYARQILSCLVFLILCRLPNFTVSCLVLSHPILSSLALPRLLNLDLLLLPTHLSAPPTSSPPLPPYTQLNVHQTQRETVFHRPEKEKWSSQYDENDYDDMASVNSDESCTKTVRSMVSNSMSKRPSLAPSNVSSLFDSISILSPSC